MKPVNTNDPDQWFFDVVNGCGDICTVPLRLRKATRASRRACHGLAVRYARTILPHSGQLRVTKSYQLP